MSYLVLNRINAQLEASKRIQEKKQKIIEQINQIPAEETKPVKTPIQPEELRELLMNELEEFAPENKEVDSTVIEETKETHRIFSGVENFVEWLIPNKQKFTENQIIPLTTLIQVRDSINVGCGCRRNQRLQTANQYFQTFWERNSNTDLPAKILEIGGFESIAFSTPLSPNFLIYPPAS